MEHEPDPSADEKKVNAQGRWRTGHSKALYESRHKARFEQAMKKALSEAIEEQAPDPVARVGEKLQPPDA